jgi:predicted enzyme related to lactoylglutathione lyase
MGRVVHFEVTADDPERAVRFYEKAMGWKIERYAGPQTYWLVTTGEAGDMGINGAIMTRAGVGQGTINTIAVARIEDAIEAVRQAGGTADGQISDIHNVGRFTYALDTEGNMLGLLEALPS